PASSDNPTGHILALLAATAGVPYFVLASTAPLVQRWHSLPRPASPPWRLYALSNFGSFLALLTYPFVVEPYFRLRTQAWMWSGLYTLFAGLCAWNALRVPPAKSENESSEGPPPSVPTVLLWLGLSAAGSTLLLAVTNEISQEI